MTGGLFIAIEGPDGSGKATQAKLLTDWLRIEGHDVELFSFPQYGQPSAYFAEQYLAGNFGQLKDIDAERGSLFFALDRYDASFKIRAALKQNKVVVSDRYVISNMGDQGTKLDTEDKREKYYRWLDQLEFGILGIPRPDISIMLIMPPELANRLIGDREGRPHLGGHNRDLHELDASHMHRVQHNYVDISQQFPNLVTRIDCAVENHLRPIDDIQTDIRAATAKHSAK